MEFYDVIESRRTVREFVNKEVDFEAIRRILEAGNKAPTWNHIAGRGVPIENYVRPITFIIKKEQRL